MAASRADRQQVIRQLVRGGSIRTQAELVEALRGHGFVVTQATVSRDISELDLQKGSSGVYALAEDVRFETAVANTVRETRRAGNQVLVFTDPGSASGLAAALDSSRQEGVLGSIAGDDTVLVIAADENVGKRFQESVDSLLASK